MTKTPFLRCCSVDADNSFSLSREDDAEEDTSGRTSHRNIASNNYYNILPIFPNNDQSEAKRKNNNNNFKIIIRIPSMSQKRQKVNIETKKSEK